MDPMSISLVVSLSVQQVAPDDHVSDTPPLLKGSSEGQRRKEPSRYTHSAALWHSIDHHGVAEMKYYGVTLTLDSTVTLQLKVQASSLLTKCSKNDAIL